MLTDLQNPQCNTVNLCARQFIFFRILAPKRDRKTTDAANPSHADIHIECLTLLCRLPTNEHNITHQTHHTLVLKLSILYLDYNITPTTQGPS